jgi:hypothetical protein
VQAKATQNRTKGDSTMVDFTRGARELELEARTRDFIRDQIIP